MHFKDFQEQARQTDQIPVKSLNSDPHTPMRHDVIPLLGLVGEVGGLLAEYKKRLRDGETHSNFSAEVAEELGDILWYIANVADKFGLELETVAEQNIAKVTNRWLPSTKQQHLYDDDLPVSQQLPRKFEYLFEERSVNGDSKVFMVDQMNRKGVGNELTDNAYEDDGYRYHDVMHLAFAAKFGWSPVLRKLLRSSEGYGITNRTPKEVDDAEDGGRAQVVEEAIVASAYVYASEHRFLKDVEVVDWELLRYITKMTTNLEVQDRSTREWNDVLLQGFCVWRKLRMNGGGTVVGNLCLGTLQFKP